MPSISQYTSSVTGGSVPILGYLVFYSITGVRVPHSEAVDLLDEASFASIGAGFPQKPPRDDDVFKRVASEAKRINQETGDPDIMKNVLIRNVGSANNLVTRRIVVENVTRSKKVLDYAQFFDVEFNKVSGVVTKRQLITPDVDNAESGALAEEVADEIIAQYLAWRGCLNSWAIREWMRHELHLAHATVVRRGIYFVAAEHEPLLSELGRFVGLIPGHSILHTVPLVDEGKQRVMLEAAYETEAQAEIDSLLVKVSTMVHKGTKINEKARQEIIDQVAHLNSKMVGYKQLLNTNFDLASARLSLLDEVMDDFTGLEVRRKKTKPGQSSIDRMLDELDEI